MSRRTWEQYEQYLIQRWPLTRREVQVAVECIKGRPNKEIASKLAISAETVNKTLDNIYRTIGVDSRYKLVANLLIADIDATPLQQSSKLAREGASLVAAGFLDTINATRGRGKRPRSGIVDKTESKNVPGRIRLPKSDAEHRAVESSDNLTAVAAAGSVGSPLTVTEKPNASMLEEGPD